MQGSNPIVGAFSAILDENTTGFQVTTGNQVGHDVTFTVPSGATKARFTLSERIFQSNAPGGPSSDVVVTLDGSTIWPKGNTGSPGGNNASVITQSQVRTEWKTQQIIATGLVSGSSHEVKYLYTKGVSAGTLEIDYSLLVIDFLP